MSRAIFRNDGARFTAFGRRRVQVAAALGVLAVLACEAPDASGLPRARVTIQGRALEVEVARTPAARQQGLSGRDRLEPGTGLLFLHPTAERHRYWMKDMRFAIDILWMREGRIVDVSHRVAPPAPGQDGREIVVTPRVPCDAVLELPAGHARAYGFDTGQRVSIELPDDPVESEKLHWH